MTVTAVTEVVPVAVEEIDLWRVLSDRFRSRLDLTLPMQETFGDEGSTTEFSDFPLTDALRFGKSLAFSSRRLRRLFTSAQEVFRGLGKPIIVALDFRFSENRCELLLEPAFKFLEEIEFPLVDSFLW